MDNKERLIKVLNILEPGEIDQLCYTALQFAMNGFYRDKPIDKSTDLQAETKENPVSVAIEDREMTYYGNKCTVREAIILGSQDSISREEIAARLVQNHITGSIIEACNLVDNVLDNNTDFIGVKNG